jgi:hypothetical protein
MVDREPDPAKEQRNNNNNNNNINNSRSNREKVSQIHEGDSTFIDA